MECWTVFGCQGERKDIVHFLCGSGMDVSCNDQFVDISASKNSIYSISIVIPFGSTGRSVTIAAVSVAALTCCYDVKAPSSVGVIAFHQWLMTLYKQDMTQILNFIQKTKVQL